MTKTQAFCSGTMANMRRLFVLLLSSVLLVCVPMVSGCHPQPAASAGPSRETTVAFASAVAALEVLDTLHAQRLAAMESPTPEQLQWASAFSARLHTLRDSLAVVRSWLEGQAEDRDGIAAFHAAADVLRLLVDDLKSQSIEIPRAVEVGLAAAKYFI